MAQVVEVIVFFFVIVSFNVQRFPATQFIAKIRHAHFVAQLVPLDMMELALVTKHFDVFFDILVKARCQRPDDTLLEVTLLGQAKILDQQANCCCID